MVDFLILPNQKNFPKIHLTKRAKNVIIDLSKKKGNIKMTIYLGMVLNDYAEVVCIGLSKEETQEILDTFPQSDKWVDRYECGPNEAFEIP